MAVTEMHLIFNKEWEERSYAFQERQGDPVVSPEVCESQNYALVVQGVKEWDLLDHAVRLQKQNYIWHGYVLT